MFLKLTNASKNWLSKAENENEFAKLIAIAIIFLLFFFILAIAFISLDVYLNWSQTGSSSNFIAKAGTFGDFLGGTLNPIFSFLTFMGLLVTILLQSKELEQTRQELQRSAKAQEQTELTLKIQTENIEIQKFENTFFSLLNQHNELLKEITKPDSTRNDKKPVIEVISIHTVMNQNLLTAKEALKIHNHKCGHYFRVLYQLLKFIAIKHPGANFSNENDALHEYLLTKTNSTEKLYSNIVRSFINDDVLQVLAVNCYCENEHDTYYTYKLLVERYSFFEHMPFTQFTAALEHAKEFYSPRAFGNSSFI